MNYTSEILYTHNKDEKIFGVMYKPSGENKKYPVCVLGHGFNGKKDEMKPYAEYLARHGICAYYIDFRGGCETSRSDGDTLKMSIVTEAEDFVCVVDEISKLDYIDENNIFLSGVSQGGIVTSVAAAKIPDKIRGIVPMYPGYMIPEMFRRQYPDRDAIGEKQFHFVMEIGRIYFEHAWAMDVYKEISAYEGPVLILCGDKDEFVSIEDCEKAVAVYKNARLHVYPGQPHGFTGEYFTKSCEELTAFIKENCF